MTGTYSNSDRLPRKGDKVYRYRVWDGSPLAGRLIPVELTIVELYDVDPQVNACNIKSYALLSDGGYAYTWNLFFAGY